MMHESARRSRWIKPRPLKPGTNPILFFDGVCGLCSSVVDFTINKDLEKRFRFSPLQSDYAAKTLDSKLAQDLSTLVVMDDGIVLTKSAAVIRLASHLGGIWRIAELGLLLPTVLRDSLYDLIAKNRYSWFGKKESCRLPTPEERARFL